MDRKLSLCEISSKAKQRHRCPPQTFQWKQSHTKETCAAMRLSKSSKRKIHLVLYLRNSILCVCLKMTQNTISSGTAEACGMCVLVTPHLPCCCDFSVISLMSAHAWLPGDTIMAGPGNVSKGFCWRKQGVWDMLVSP